MRFTHENAPSMAAQRVVRNRRRGEITGSPVDQIELQ